MGTTDPGDENYRGMVLDMQAMMIVDDFFSFGARKFECDIR